MERYWSGESVGDVVGLVMDLLVVGGLLVEEANVCRGISSCADIRLVFGCVPSGAVVLYSGGEVVATASWRGGCSDWNSNVGGSYELRRVRLSCSSSPN